MFNFLANYRILILCGRYASVPEVEQQGLDVPEMGAEGYGLEPVPHTQTLDEAA